MKNEEINSIQYVEKLASLFEEQRNETLALPMTKYMKGLFTYYGIKAPLRQSILRDFIKKNGQPEDWKTAVKLCWQYDEREMQYVGMELAFRSKKKWVESDLSFFEYLIISKSWWDTVDYIASNIIGHYFFIYPGQIKPKISQWNLSPNMWLNRTCLIFQLKYRDYTDFKLLQKIIHQHKYSKEFFIQKAIGWSLRQYARTSPKDVRAFVTETELKPLSRREALKHFS